MAVTKSILKNTEVETIVKVAGTAGAATIALDTDLLASTQALSGSNQTAVLCGLQWTGANGGVIEISRNGVIVTTLQANAAGALEMGGQAMLPDPTEKASDIVVTISGAQAEVWMRLKKLTGYTSKVETSIYGQYDDETRVGASTDIQGSPDYEAP